MAIWTFPLKSINGSNMYSDKDFRRFYANIFSSGIIPNVDLEGNLSLQVLQTETPSMNIRVGPGVDMINGGHIMNTAIKEFPIPAPLTTQERIDCIVAQWNDSTNSGDIIYKKNTTQIVRSQDIWEHKLAEIVVPANATSISQANITDTRANPDVCGYSSPFEKIDVGDLAAQFKALTDEYNLEFQAWFKNLKNQLDDNQAANLQNQIDNLSETVVKITDDQTISGKKTFTDDVDTTNLNVSETLSVNKLEISSDLPKEKVVAKSGFTVGGDAWYRVKNGMLQISCTGISITANVPAGAWKDVCSLPNADFINSSGDTTVVIMNGNNAIYVGARARVINGVMRILPSSAIAPTQYLNDFIIMAID
ncbi:hypothetical protein [Lactococcus petauri]